MQLGELYRTNHDKICSWFVVRGNDWAAAEDALHSAVVRMLVEQVELSIDVLWKTTKRELNRERVAYWRQRRILAKFPAIKSSHIDEPELRAALQVAIEQFQPVRLSHTPDEWRSLLAQRRVVAQSGNRALTEWYRKTFPGVVKATAARALQRAERSLR